MPSAQVTWGGAVGLYPYQLGVAATLQQHFDLDDVVWIGQSAGCFSALCCALGWDCCDAISTLALPVAARLRQAPFGWVFEHNAAVRDVIVPKLPIDAPARLRGKLYAAVTEVPGFRLHLIGDWRCTADLAEGLSASAFLPIADLQGLVYTHRDRWCVDGSIAGYGLTHRPAGGHVPAMMLSVDRWRTWEIKDYNINTDPAEIWRRFELGRRDARAHLDELAAVLPPKKVLGVPEAQRCRA